MCARSVWLLVGFTLLGCAGRPVSGVDDSADSTGDADSSTGDGDGDPSTGDGDGDPSTGDGDGDPSTGDGDGEPACPEQQLLCADETCQWDLGNPYPCCAHGGDCPPGCEAQDAAETSPGCDDPNLFAWDGQKCRGLCECIGSSCAELYPSARTCLEAHDQTCGSFEFGDCPFDTLLGPTLITGTTPFGPRSFTAGSFGIAYGEGPPGLALRLGATELELGNYIGNLASPFEIDDGILFPDYVVPEVGVHDVSVYVAGDWQQAGVGTLTITSIDYASPLHADYSLEATLDIDSEGWQLAGPIAIYGCDRLDSFAP